MNKKTLIAMIFAGVGVVGASVSATFLPIRRETAKVQVSNVTFDDDKLEYEVYLNYNFATQEFINESYIVKDIKLGANSNGRANLVSHYDLWGNFKFKSLENVYYNGVIYLKR